MTDPLAPLPAIYVPPDVDRPAHIARYDIVRLREPIGPDGQAGVCYGCGPDGWVDRQWAETPAGWWVEVCDWHCPQILARIQPHAQILRFRTVPGIRDEHLWRVPVLLAPLYAGDGERGEISQWVSAVDRVWKGGDVYVPDQEILSLQRDLLAIALGVPLRETDEGRTSAVREVACHLLALTHHLDPNGGEIAARGWLSDSVTERVILAALGMDGADPDPFDQIGGAA